MNWQQIKMAGTIILCGSILMTSTASGSHLNSKFSTSDSPSFHPKKQTQPRKTHSSYPPKSRLTSLAQPKLQASKNHLSVTTASAHQKPTGSPTKIGWRYLLRGRPQAAMAAYRQAIRQNAQSATAFLGLGITLKSLGKFNLAEKALVKAVKLDPKLPSALVHLGYLYANRHSRQTNLSTARRLFQQAKQLGDPFAAIALLDIQSQANL